MRLALMTDDHSQVVRIFSGVVVEWGGCTHSNVTLLSHEERICFHMFDVATVETPRPDNSVEDGYEQTIDPLFGVVTLTRRWRQMTPSEISSALKAKAKKDLATSDIPLVRVLEDLIDILVSKGTITLSDLPEEARDRLRDRKAYRNILKG